MDEKNNLAGTPRDPRAIDYGQFSAAIEIIAVIESWDRVQWQRVLKNMACSSPEAFLEVFALRKKYGVFTAIKNLPKGHRLELFLRAKQHFVDL